jgi:Glycosyl transferase family 2
MDVQYKLQHGAYQVFGDGLLSGAGGNRVRVGRNPLDGLSHAPLPPIIGAVITHLPNRKGYHAQRFEVIKTCLKSMRYNAGVPFPMYVWDNGSDAEFVEWLRCEFKPTWLTISPNVGKSSARTAIIRTFPLETIICMSDDDIYYYPDWLKPQLELLNGFPNVGAVSGYPVRTQHRWGNKSTLRWANDNAKISVGRFIPDEWEHDFCDSVGRNYQDHLHMTADDQDVLIEYRGLKAYGTAHHCQFVAIAGRIENLVEWADDYLPREQHFDNAIDAQGYLRLTTTQRLARHIGNVIHPELRREIDGKQLLHA